MSRRIIWLLGVVVVILVGSFLENDSSLAQFGMCDPPCGPGAYCVCDGGCGTLLCHCESSGGGSGGENPTQPPSPPEPTPPPPGGGGGGPTPTGGGGDDPAPSPGGGEDPAPTPISDPNIECWSCYAFGGCSSGYADLCAYVDDLVAWPISYSCVAAGLCEESESDLPDDGDSPEPPCIPGISPPQAGCEETNAEWGYSLRVGARVPPHRVQVDPFPRWIVGMGCPDSGAYDFGDPGRLTLQDYPAFTPPGLCTPNGPGYSEGCWSEAVAFPQRLSDEEPQPGDVRDYRLGLRWRRIDQVPGEDHGPIPPICWTFDERGWNVGQDYGCGVIFDQACGPTAVTHIYETSSWGLANNGPRFLTAEEACPPGVDACCEQVPSGPGEWDMPAYQVRVPTYWAAEWKVEWEAWEVVGREGECVCLGGAGANECSGEEGLCVNAPWTEHWAWIDDPVYDWVDYGEGWHTLDLRDFGESTWYYTSWSVITTGEGPWCAYEYADPNPGATVRVPVIEIQVPLRDPCVIAGTCPPGYGEGGLPVPPQPTPVPEGGCGEEDPCPPWPE